MIFNKINNLATVLTPIAIYVAIASYDKLGIENNSFVVKFTFKPEKKELQVIKCIVGS